MRPRVGDVITPPGPCSTTGCFTVGVAKLAHVRLFFYIFACVKCALMNESYSSQEVNVYNGPYFNLGNGHFCDESFW